MKDMLKETVIKIHALSVRERFILMLVLLAVIFMLCNMLLLAPLDKEKPCGSDERIDGKKTF